MRIIMAKVIVTPKNTEIIMGEEITTAMRMEIGDKQPIKYTLPVGKFLI
jgi:hypothetical protein